MHDWGLEQTEGAARATFFERVTKDIEIVRVALLLTGCIQGESGLPGGGAGVLLLVVVMVLTVVLVVAVMVMVRHP